MDFAAMILSSRHSLSRSHIGIIDVFSKCSKFFISKHNYIFNIAEKWCMKNNVQNLQNLTT